MKKGDDEFMKRMPDTGGDFIDGNDVEGHKRLKSDEELRRDSDDSVLKREGDEFARRYSGDESDVEGHRLKSAAGDGAEELYRGGPSTQGEVIRRGPGDNPHGDR